jgi:hypothetical protein
VAPTANAPRSRRELELVFFMDFSLSRATFLLLVGKVAPRNKDGKQSTSFPNVRSGFYHGRA